MGNNVNDYIRFENVSLMFGDRIILDNVSFTVREGEIFVILGPSGAGKSSILKALLGLWKPDSGKIFINGSEITSMDENELLPFRKRMGIVFQSNALFDSLTVEENIAYFLRERNLITEEDIKKRVKEYLLFVNLKNTENLFPEELSGGMKKRVAIARAIAFNPDIILYDEPTTGIDPINARTIIDLILKIQKEGATSIVVTHYITNAIVIGNKFAVIKDGSIIFKGSIEDILSQEDEFIKEFFSELLLENEIKKNIRKKIEN